MVKIDPGVLIDTAKMLAEASQKVLKDKKRQIRKSKDQNMTTSNK
jgi:hypothetical protein